MSDIDQWNLNDKIQYWKKDPGDKDSMRVLFSSEEYDILDAVYQFEIFDRAVTERLEKAKLTGSISETFIRVEEEAEISVLLKERFMRQMDILLEKGTAEAWIEIMIWYSLLEEEKLIVEDFWEFPALRTMIDIFMKELNVFLEKGGASRISILSLHNMQELTDAYFKVIFLCRRIEYGVEPVDEIIEYIEKKQFSDTFIRAIIQTAQIFNEEKVISIIEEWCWK